MYIALRTFKYVNEAGELVMAKPGDKIANVDTWPTGPAMHLQSGLIRVASAEDDKAEKKPAKKKAKGKRGRPKKEAKVEEVQEVEAPEETKAPEATEEPEATEDSEMTSEDRRKLLGLDE